MFRHKITSSLTLILLLLLIPSFSSPASTENEGETKLSIVATTTVGETLAREIGRDKVTIKTIISPGVCPSHYDLSPRDVTFVQRASLILFHGMEPWLEKLVDLVSNQDTISLQLEGPWNFPPRVRPFAKKIAHSLSRLDPSNAPYYQHNLAQFLSRLDETTDQIRTKAQKLHLGKINVITMAWQTGFLRWLGLNVVKTYPPPEQISLKQLGELVKTGKRENVNLIVDNLQSGTDFGAKLAQTLGVQHVILTNFPGGLASTDDYREMILKNAEIVLEAAKQLTTKIN